MISYSMSFFLTWSVFVTNFSDVSGELLKVHIYQDIQIAMRSSHEKQFINPF